MKFLVVQLSFHHYITLYHSFTIIMSNYLYSPIVLLYIFNNESSLVWLFGVILTHACDEARCYTPIRDSLFVIQGVIIHFKRIHT